MISALYIEDEVRGHPLVEAIAARFPRAARVACERYTEVFNPRAQSFRLQKKRPALILARKFDGLVLPAPNDYGLGGVRNFYFSHMLNCLYDCRYCFLQGMYRSAHYVLFVNYEDFHDAIDRTLVQAPDENTWFFSGYDCDSLATEPVTRFVENFLPFFRGRPQAWLELRTKSTQVRALLHAEPFERCVVAFSFTPQETASALEHKVPSVERRIDAMARLQARGWPVGLRFDPLIYRQGFVAQYHRLFAQVFASIDAGRVHSVSLGPFRVPSGYFHNVVKLYPYEPLFAGPLGESKGMVSYHADLEQEMTQRCTDALLEYIDEDLLFSCAP
ncbi:MAG: SPL family radical SAM protein [Gammaproteobacteria bacterium]